MTDASPAQALARCVGDVEAFLGERFGAAPHTWQGGGFDDLLSADDVDRLLTGHGLRRPVVRLVHDGQVLDPASWTRGARTGNVRIGDLVDGARVLDHFSAGATVVLQSLQRWWPPLTAFCRQLELELGHAVQANAYLTPAGAAGLDPHHDTHDVFVLQVHGTKHWVVREPVVDTPLPSQRSSHEEAGRQPVRSEELLSGGSCLYLPRGFVHSARAQDGMSLHLTIGVLATTVHDLLRQLVDRAATEEVALRRSLPPKATLDQGGAAAAVKQAVGDLMAWLERLDPEAPADELVRRFAAARRPLLDGQLAQLVALDTIDDATVLGPRPGNLVRSEREADQLVLELGDRRLRLPERLAPAIELVLDGNRHRVADLDRLLDGPSRLVLARRLVREGVLRIETDA